MAAALVRPNLARCEVQASFGVQSSVGASSKVSVASLATRFHGLQLRADSSRRLGHGARAASRMQVNCGYHIPTEHRWMYEDIEKMGPDVWETTYYPKAADHLNVEKQWYVVDASNKRLGRLASAIAYHIRGKHTPEYTPSVDMGAYVVVINAEKIEVTGKKRSQKLYRRHSGRPGGMKIETFDQLQKRIPERIVEHAVKGMLPKGRLGRRLFTHLKVYKGDSHPHTAQQPAPLPLKDPLVEMV